MYTASVPQTHRLPSASMASIGPTVGGAYIRSTPTEGVGVGPGVSWGFTVCSGVSGCWVEPPTGWAVTPLPSRHGPQEEQTFLFLIEKGKSAVFYGNDTGVFGEEIDEFLAERGKKLTLLSLDCNKGDKSENYDTHMSMRENKTIAERFAAKGITDENTKIYVTHFSHNCGMIYDELCKAAEKYGFTVAYDGLTLEV